MCALISLWHCGIMHTILEKSPHCIGSLYHRYTVAHWWATKVTIKLIHAAYMQPKIHMHSHSKTYHYYFCYSNNSTKILVTNGYKWYTYNTVIKINVENRSVGEEIANEAAKEGLRFGIYRISQSCLCTKRPVEMHLLNKSWAVRLPIWLISSSS